MSCLGFFYFNFNPAKIFMGDTGSQFLGLMLGILTLLNLKNILLFSFLVPVLILIIPILDTCLAILRRYLNGKPLGMADRGHLHHRFIDKGMSQKKTVCFIYTISILSNVSAVLLSSNILWLSFIVLFVLLIGLELLIEYTNILDKNYRPILNLILRIKN